MAFSVELKEKIKHLLTLYPIQQAALLPTLHLVQDEYGYLSEETQELVAEELEIPLSEVREVVTFYVMFHDQPIGKYHFEVCQNISCSIMGAESVIEHLEKRLGIRSGETSEDGKFSLARVECLGACDGAPMMELNGQFEVKLTPEKIDKIIDELK